MHSEVHSRSGVERANRLHRDVSASVPETKDPGIVAELHHCIRQALQGLFVIF